MNSSKCKTCNEEQYNFIAAKCKIRQYCSDECKNKDYKDITINLHDDVINLTMRPDLEFHKFNSEEKECWEVNHDIILPNLKDLPMTISFIINNKLQIDTIMMDHSDLQKGCSTRCKLEVISGAIIFDIYRSMDDMYKIFRIYFIETN